MAGPEYACLPTVLFRKVRLSLSEFRPAPDRVQLRYTEQALKTVKRLYLHKFEEFFWRAKKFLN